MKKLPSDIVLRPRFQLDIPLGKEALLQCFEKSEAEPFLVKRLDEHIFIKFNKNNSHFWSPQLHLEIDEIDGKTAKLSGVFGPNPTLWTFFMFLHFGVATIFLILGIWAYSNASLNKHYERQLALMVFMVVIWLLLYYIGRAGKYKGESQTEELYRFMMNVLTD